MGAPPFFVCGCGGRRHAARRREGRYARFMSSMSVARMRACSARSLTEREDSAMARAVSPAMALTWSMERLISSLEADCSSEAVAMARTWSAVTPAIFEVYGTKGVILAVDDDIKIKTVDTQKYLRDGWVVPRLPDPLPHPTRQWVDSCLYGKEIRYGVQEGRMLTALMENAYIADRERREVKF